VRFVPLIAVLVAALFPTCVNASTWVNPVQDLHVATTVDLQVRVDDASPPIMCMGVTFYDREQAQGGHPAPEWQDHGSATQDSTDPLLFHSPWMIANHSHNGNHDLKAVVHWMMMTGMPPSFWLWDEELPISCVADNIIVTCSSSQPATPDPHVLKFNPDDPSLDSATLSWEFSGAFDLDTVGWVDVSISDGAGGDIKRWVFEPTATSGDIEWDGTNEMGFPVPAGLYAFSADALRWCLDVHNTRNSDVTVMPDGQDPLMQRWDKPGTGAVKFRFDYDVQDYQQVGAETLVATLYDPDLNEVDSSSLIPDHGTQEAYVTFEGIDFSRHEPFHVALTYDEKAQHSQWNKDHEPDFGSPLFPSFGSPPAVNFGTSSFPGDAAIAAYYQQWPIDDPSWYAAKSYEGLSAEDMRAEVNALRPSIVYYGGHADGYDYGTLEPDYALCGYDATYPGHDATHATTPQPVASTNPAYQWDLSRCVLCVWAACYSARERFHGRLHQAAVDRGADCAVAFWEGTGTSSLWTDYFWGHLCCGADRVGCPDHGTFPPTVLNALTWAAAHVLHDTGSAQGYDEFVIAGSEFVRVVPVR